MADQEACDRTLEKQPWSAFGVVANDPANDHQRAIQHYRRKKHAGPAKEDAYSTHPKSRRQPAGNANEAIGQ
jgi:hypothetical protein